MKKKEQKRLQDETSGVVSGLKFRAERGREREKEGEGRR